jgi:hypothetical protein
MIRDIEVSFHTTTNYSDGKCAMFYVIDEVCPGIRFLLAWWHQFKLIMTKSLLNHY